jgi:hypothetical protein
MKRSHQKQSHLKKQKTDQNAKINQWLKDHTIKKTKKTITLEKAKSRSKRKKAEKKQIVGWITTIYWIVGEVVGSSRCTRYAPSPI